MSTPSAPFDCEVGTASFNRQMVVPTSKSYANRLLILGAISESEFKIADLPESTDVLGLMGCLSLLGTKIIKKGEDVVISGQFPKSESKNAGPLELSTGDGGTTNRFLLGLLARGSRIYRLKAKGHMKDRPMRELIDILSQLGAKVKVGEKNDPFWIEIQGPMTQFPKEIPVDCSRSTQFISGLALALADAIGVQIQPQGMRASADYWEMTKHLVTQFKEGKREFRVPVDFSSLSYPLASGLTLGPVVVKNCLTTDPYQADSVFLDIIKEMGGEIEWSPAGVRLAPPPKLRAIKRNCAAFPDLVPTLAYVCAYAEGVSRLENVGVLRHKESDRIEEVCNLLKLFGVRHEVQNEQGIEHLVIHGLGPNFTPTPRLEIKAVPDHRIIMTAYLFLRKNSGGRISNAHHVAKSFPHFFKAMQG